MKITQNYINNEWWFLSIRYIHKSEWFFATCTNVDILTVVTFEPKELDIKPNIVYNAIYLKFTNRQKKNLIPITPLEVFSTAWGRAAVQRAMETFA